MDQPKILRILRCIALLSSNRSVKVKLYIKMYTDKSSYTEHKWVQQVFYLEKGKTIEVALEDNSLVGNKEP